MPYSAIELKRIRSAGPDLLRAIELLYTSNFTIDDEVDEALSAAVEKATGKSPRCEKNACHEHHSN